jgi:hypothetical protein
MAVISRPFETNTVLYCNKLEIVRPSSVADTRLRKQDERDTVEHPGVRETRPDHRSSISSSVTKSRNKEEEEEKLVSPSDALLCP